MDTPSNPTQAQIDAAKALTKASLNTVMKEMADASPEFVPGTTVGLDLTPEESRDYPDNYKQDFLVEINGVAMTDADIEYVETTLPDGKKRYRANLKIPTGGKVRIWVRRPKS